MAVPTRIIDVHQHCFWHGGDDAYLVANLDEHGIDKAVLLTWLLGEVEGLSGYDGVFNSVHGLPGRRHPGLVLADVIDAVRRYPDRFLVGYCPHPLDPQAIPRLASAVKMYDVRMCAECKFRVPMDDPRCIELFRAAGRLGLPVTFHLDLPWVPNPPGEPTYSPKWYGGTIDNLRRAIDACPDTVFVGHAPGFWREISGDADKRPEGYPDGPLVEGGRLLALFDECPTLMADLSAGSALRALKRDPKFARGFLLKHQDRLMFARDCYDGLMHEFLQSLDLPQEPTEKIYHLNAEKLLRIDP